MMDFKDYLIKNRMIVEPGKENEKPPLPNVFQSRNLLLAKAKGSIREHLQRQLLEELSKFREETSPQYPGRIV